MITFSDLIILVGVACVLAGCWMRSVPDFVIGVGVAVCLAGWVVGKLMTARRQRRR